MGIGRFLSIRERALPLLREAVREGLTDVAAEERVRASLGSLYRHEPFRNDMRMIRHEEATSALLKNLPMNARIPTDYLLPSDRDLRKQYLYVLSYQAVDEQGDTYTDYVHIASDRLLTRADVEAKTLELVTAGSGYAGVDIAESPEETIEYVYTRR